MCSGPAGDRLPGRSVVPYDLMTNRRTAFIAISAATIMVAVAGCGAGGRDEHHAGRAARTAVSSATEAPQRAGATQAGASAAPARPPNVPRAVTPSAVPQAAQGVVITVHRGATRRDVHELIGRLLGRSGNRRHLTRHS